MSGARVSLRRGVLARLGLGLVAVLAAGPAGAAPPAVGSEDWEIMAPHAEWIRGLQRAGILCCTMADGRPVEARSRGERWQVRWRPGQLAGTPEGWVDVPPDVVMHMHNPVGMAVVFWIAGEIRCFVPPGGV